MLEELLAESESGTLVEATAVLIVDSTGNLNYVSPSAANVLAAKREDVVYLNELVRQYCLFEANEQGEVRELIMPAKDGKFQSYAVEVHDTGLKGCERIITIRQADALTARHLRTELALKRSEGLLRDLLDSTFEAIVGLDNNGLCTFINKSALDLLGYDTAEELVGKNMHWTYHHSKPDGSPFAEAECAQLLGLYAGKPVHNRDVVFWRKDGSSFPASSRFQPFLTDGGPSGGVVTFLDISAQIKNSQEKENLRQQLLQYQKMDAIGTLASGIAHDFNNILSGIIGYGELIEMFEVKSQTELRQKIGYMLQAAYRARELVKQILTFSRKMEISCKKIHLVPLINETLVLLRASFPATISIETSITAEKDTVFADSTQMHQVLLNLCTNALDAMQEDGGALVIKLMQVDGGNGNTTHPDLLSGRQWLFLEIQDSGVGIAPEVMDRVFEPYFTTKMVGEGTGLGLAMVYGIVRSLNGHIFLKSRDGVGSTVEIFLPLHEEEEKDSENTAGCLDGGSSSLLLVDDEPGIVAAYKEVLERLGYAVTATTSSSEALQYFARAPESFDLVITDQTMPGMTGLNLALNVREIRGDIPILFCTGSETPIPQQALPGSGGLVVLAKPVSLHVLTKSIRQALDAGNNEQ